MPNDRKKKTWYICDVRVSYYLLFIGCINNNAGQIHLAKKAKNGNIFMSILSPQYYYTHNIMLITWNEAFSVEWFSIHLCCALSITQIQTLYFLKLLNLAANFVFHWAFNSIPDKYS